MSLSLLEELRKLDVDVDEGTDRLMGNTSLYERMLFKFDDIMGTLLITPDFDDNESPEVLEKAHTIKGSAGNLSITPLYEAYDKIVQLLRKGQPEQARSVLKEIYPVQTDILNCIRRHKAKEAF